MAKFISSVVYNGIGEIGSRLPYIVTEIFIAKSLGVANYGIWAIIQLVVNYNNFSHFGLLSGLSKLEPLLIGNQSERKIELLRSNSFYPVAFIDAIILFLGLAFYSIGWIKLDIINNDINLIISLTLLLIMQQLFLYAQVRLQNIVDFKTLSQGKLILSTSFMLFVILQLDALNLDSVVFSWVVSYLITNIYLFLKSQILPRPNFTYSILKELFWVGIPIFLMGIVKLFLVSLDKIAVINYFSSSEVATYNISLQAMLIMTMVIGLISRVFSPIFINVSTKNASQSDAFYYDTKLLSFIGGSILAFICSFLFISIIDNVLPEFESGKIPGVFLIFSGIYQGGIQLAISKVMVLNREKKLLYFYLLSGGSYAAILFFLGSNSFSLISISVTNLIFWIVLDIAVCRAILKEKPTLSFKYNSVIIIYLFLSVALLESDINMITYTIISIGFSLISLTAFFFITWRRIIQLNFLGDRSSYE
ncbi:oligosaccharide flippase family protein [Vibrio coralliilyticus]|uniref:oligosaccharide flippase family protein n=1 Tax=Vibrio coralliilyticus TaxID=190893 RepID=UPI0017ED00C1|nr:oligosaccharide flippase family protein [Vibrio coralliilyticus]NUW68973.1 oligosaccharide flippase family protein [Vibrio coralliilyticus]